MSDNKTKFFFAEVKKIDENNRTIDAVASTSERDRDGDIILPAGIQKHIKSFLANPVILACHQHRLSSGNSPVIGSAIVELVKFTKTQMTFRMRFAATELGEEYWSLYKDKHMRAFSIGFMPIKWVDSDEGRTYTEIELLEISAVPVPSNRRAMARAKGYFDNEGVLTDDIKTYIKEQIESEIKDAVNKSVDERLDDIVLSGVQEGFGDALLAGKSNEPTVPAADDKQASLKSISASLKEIVNNI
jgi:HK97 family phage prohead protease